MLFEISAETRGGLRVIPTIPNINLCWLEGRNGIGKTVAVRLLELVAGKQPFNTDADAWMALKQNLGPTTIEISEFPETAAITSITVELTPDLWPNQPTPLAANLGTVFIDGNLSDHQTLRDYIDIVRIGGDETVVSQLRNLVSADHTLTIRCRDSLDDAAKEIEQILTPLIIDLDRLSESDFTEAHDAVEIARKRVASSDSALQAISQRRNDLQELIELYELQEEQAKLGPQVQLSLDEYTSRVQALTEQKDSLADKLRALVPEHAASQQLQLELDRLYQLWDGRRRRAARTHFTAQQALEAAEVQRAELPRAFLAATRQRSGLRKQRAALASLPRILEIIDATRQPLAEVTASSLDTEVVAVLDGAQRITTSALRSGLDAREEELQHDDTYDNLIKIDRQIQESEARIRRLKHARELLKDANRKAALLVEVEQQIEQTTQQLRDSTGDEYSMVSHELRNIESDLTDAITRLTECRVHLDLLNRRGGVRELTTKIDELGRRLDLSSDDVSAELDDTASRHRAAASDHQQYRLDLTDKLKAHQTLEEQLLRAIQLIARSADYRWLRDSVTIGNLPTIGTDRQDAMRQLTRLVAAARTTQLGVEQALNRLASVQDALGGLEKSIETHREPPRNQYVDGLTKWYEGQMTEYLSNPDIREALFDGGEFQHFDLLNGFVSWLARTGEQRRRPIEAFSSGERAFSYMLAALLSHQDSSAKYRVFVLDEFGAFVEQSRRNRLWHFLDKRILQTGTATQVVVILPSQSTTPTEGQSDRFEAEGYFAFEARL